MQYRLHLEDSINYLSIEGNTSGTILSNDIVNVDTKFNPQDQGKYKFTINLSY